MATTIAISGKGGSGKTTLAAMIIRLLSEQTGRPILAVDGDPNSCLGLTMGVEPIAVIAEVREKAAVIPASTGCARLNTIFNRQLRRLMDSICLLWVGRKARVATAQRITFCENF